jgi:RNase P subunit RPR2
MKPYKNISRESGVKAYEIMTDRIRVLFVRADEVYTYSYSKAGKRHVDKMKELAEKGKGLSTYISKYVRDLYD